MDIAIAGAGVSAILLARSLVRRGLFRRLWIVGPVRPIRAHRFAYWSEVHTPFDGFVDAHYDAVRTVSADGTESRALLHRLAYRTIDARRWFESELEQVLAADGVERIDATVDAVEDGPDHALVHAAGRSIRADWVFTNAPASEPARRQQFAGWDVRVPGGVPDAGVATLLDFRVACDGEFSFAYALPLDRFRLFVEHVSYAPCDHAAFLRSYLTETLGVRGWELVAWEEGATPLFTSRPPRRSGRIVSIGVAAGLAKPATGYALTRMWRDAEAIAAGLARDGCPGFARPPAGLHGFADAFFMDLLAHAPDQLPEVLAQLFARVNGDTILSFLDDAATAGEQLAVAATVPGWLPWLARRAAGIA